MQKCLNCNRRFSWGQVYRSFLGLLYGSIECHHCGAKHKITISGRFIVTALTVLPMLIFMYFLSDLNLLPTIGIGLVIAFAGSLIAPYVTPFDVVSLNEIDGDGRRGMNEAKHLR
ncbi:hypothetical protein JNUCC1_02614 [Lentibacillus sp. JNUCC-1]|uniref:TIGR04104 family putative zinc finger protein n=1 Tax=Lentibacillus sp. JNUCC-1 TaxID=2654513 RepID=UPI0012E9589A|nr:TIGR04104 family putative zinc finger protein [Lentibacillus sp. JNUCC-1]MUV38743.1 hypothetical protein [Lentibacillus sp. JNUCC-1]